ncbi:MAG: hypothetical protein ACAH89_15515 [Rariglobus sp.]
MPSPREILLARHRAAEPRLDAMRTAVLALETGGRRRPVLLAALRTLWRELVEPCRPAWVAFAAVWAVLLILDGTSRPAGETRRPVAAETVAAVTSWLEQRRMLAELAAPAGPSSAPAPVAAPVRDHSQLTPASALMRDVC